MSESFTSSVTSVVDQRSLFPTQLNYRDHERNDGDGGEDEGVPILGHEACESHDAVIGEKKLP